MGHKSIVDFDNKQPNPRFENVMDVPPQSILAKKDSLRIIDVRRPEEFTGELGHIPGAKLFTLDILPQKIVELPRDETLIFVCRSGGRSSQATAFALENGFQSVFNLQGGMTLWNELNLEQKVKTLNVCLRQSHLEYEAH